MGQQQSKDELVYQQVNYGNVEGIKALRRGGAGLEWIDKEGKTPLIVACMNSELYNVALTLIELGANVNAYRPGRHAGTPLHHAAKRGLERTVKLLLSHGANALVMNDDCQTPLDVARAKGFSNVVRAIESHICLFSGWLREIYGPGFLEMLAPQLVSKRVWVVVLPCGSRNLTKPFKLELVVYSNIKDAQPRTIIALWRANMEEPKFNQPDPSVTLVDNATKTRFKFAPANENDKQQLQFFCDACRGIPQASHPVFLHNNQQPVVPPTAPAAEEDLELAMAINASIQSAMEERPPIPDMQPGCQASTSTSWSNSLDTSNSSSVSNLWAGHEAGPSVKPAQPVKTENVNNISPVMASADVPNAVPSAPPITDEITEDGPVHYPSIDSSPVDISAVESAPDSPRVKKEDGSTSTCVVCLDAPVEGACVPCGHMAGCMSCLNEIRSKKWGCPVCRAKIHQVIRLYAV